MRFKTTKVIVMFLLMVFSSVGIYAEGNDRFEVGTCDLDSYVYSALERCNRGENAICPYVAIAVLDHECPLSMSVDILAQSCDKGNAFSCYTAAELFSGGYDNFVFSDSLQRYYIEKACRINKGYCKDRRDLVMKKELRCARFALHRRLNGELFTGLLDVENYYQGACEKSSQVSAMFMDKIAPIYNNGYLSVRDKRTDQILEEARMFVGSVTSENECELQFLKNSIQAKVLFGRARIDLGLQYLEKAKPCDKTLSRWSWGANAPDNVLIPDSVKRSSLFWRAP